MQLLDADPELAAGLDAPAAAHARAALPVPMIELAQGPCSFGTAPGRGAVGILVTDGLLGLQIGAGRVRFLELLGAGDVLQPAVTLGDEASTPTDLEWEVFLTTRAVILQRDAVRRASASPELIQALMTRLVLRSRRLAFQLAVTGLVRTEERLRLMLWHFADRWGRVSRDGVVLELPLTHQQLADIIRTQRPSLTTAARLLEDQGLLTRPEAHCWVLHGEPPELLRRLDEGAAVAG